MDETIGLDAEMNQSYGCRASAAHVNMQRVENAHLKLSGTA